MPLERKTFQVELKIRFIKGHNIGDSAMRNKLKQGSIAGSIFFGLIIIMTGIIILANGKMHYEQDKAFKQNAITASAVVTGVTKIEDQDNIAYNLDIEYEADGEKVKATVYNYSSQMSVGERLTVYYDKDNYNNVRAEFADIRWNSFIGIVVIVVGAFGALRKILILLIYSKHKYFKQDKIKQENSI